MMELKFLGKKKETNDVWTFSFELPQNFSWNPGQFNIYSLKHENEDVRGRQRFFTISSAPFENEINITTRISENGSTFKKALMELELGDKINAKGPDGDFVFEGTGKKYLFIAGGIGITPFRSILSELNHGDLNADIILLYSNSSDNIAFKEEFDSYKNPNLKIEYVVGKRIDENLIKTVDDFKERIIYISGPEQMVKEINNILLGLGIEKENMRKDYFPGYD